MSWQFAVIPASQQENSFDPVDLIITPRARNIGAFEVKRALPSHQKQMIGPFIFFDQMGPTVFKEDKAMDVRPHPHIGISTITWLFEGEIQHQDSLGFDVTIRPGEVNWMTAGSGIVHSERSPQSQRNVNAPLAGIQAWVALPVENEEIEPAFYHYSAEQIPHFDENGVRISLIVGTAFGKSSPVITQSSTLYAEINLVKNKSFVIPDAAQEKGIYIYQGELEIAGKPYREGSMLLFKSGSMVEIKANMNTRLMLLGGSPLEGRRHLYWNFVSSSQQRIDQAKADWRSGLFAGVEGDNEYIPLPEDE